MGNGGHKHQQQPGCNKSAALEGIVHSVTMKSDHQAASDGNVWRDRRRVSSIQGTHVSPGPAAGTLDVAQRPSGDDSQRSCLIRLTELISNRADSSPAEKITDVPAAFGPEEASDSRSRVVRGGGNAPDHILITDDEQRRSEPKHGGADELPGATGGTRRRRRRRKSVLWMTHPLRLPLTSDANVGLKRRQKRRRSACVTAATSAVILRRGLKLPSQERFSTDPLRHFLIKLRNLAAWRQRSAAERPHPHRSCLVHQSGYHGNPHLWNCDRFIWWSDRA